MQKNLNGHVQITNDSNLPRQDRMKYKNLFLMHITERFRCFFCFVFFADTQSNDLVKAVTETCMAVRE